MNWIYLSPHFDDVAFSCGGLVWQQGQQGEQVCIWTVCAADPPAAGLSPFAASLHERWQAGTDEIPNRGQEDKEANQILGVGTHHFPVPDCIYRRGQEGEHLYQTEGSLFGRLHPQEETLVKELVGFFSGQVKEMGWFQDLTVVSPLGIGNHVDHQLVRQAAERWVEENCCRLLYYADFPYVLSERGLPDKLEVQGLKRECFPVQEEAVDAWFGAAASHASQISTFWHDKTRLRRALEGWIEENGGICLWRAGKLSEIRP
jgi:LmbE family N-acetylglucosaminyl deacetylase